MERYLPKTKANQLFVKSIHSENICNDRCENRDILKQKLRELITRDPYKGQLKYGFQRECDSQ